MKRLHFSTALNSILFLLIFNFGLAQNYSNYMERIIDFQTDIVVDTTSKITVTEKIKVNANNSQIKRGIFRTLPVKRNIQDKSFFVKYKIKSIKRDNQKEPYHTANENGNFVMIINHKRAILCT